MDAPAQKKNSAVTTIVLLTLFMTFVIVMIRMKKRPQIITAEGTDEDGKSFNMTVTISEGEIKK